jgi:hypothetical protein
VKVNDAFERPGGGGALARGRMGGADAQVGEECLKAARQLAEALRLRLKLFQRFLVELPQRARFAGDCLLECAKPLVEIERVCRASLALGLAPLMKGQAETIQLSLETRQTLFQTWIARLHRELYG